MEQRQAGRIVFGGVLVVVSALLFLSAAKVALSSRTDGSESLQPQVDPRLKQKLFKTPSTSQPNQAHAKGSDPSQGVRPLVVSQDDFDRVFREDLVAVASPAGSTPDEVLATILESRTLPQHIRAPFVALAKARAPHLVTAEDAAQF